MTEHMTLWEQMASGRPAGQPTYHRPPALNGRAIELPWVGLGLLDVPEKALAEHLRGKSLTERLSTLVTSVCGITRHEPHDLLGPHHVSPSIRGVRVTELEAQWTTGAAERYDPVAHAWIIRSEEPRNAPVPRRLTLTVDCSRVPEGYAPIREMVGLLEAGMYLATMTWLAGYLLPEWSVSPQQIPESPTTHCLLWPMVGLHAPGEPVAATPPASRLSGLLRTLADPLPHNSDTTVAALLRQRSSGRGPWGVTPRRRSPDQRDAARSLLQHAAGQWQSPHGMRVHFMSSTTLGEAFSYPADRVDVASGDFAMVWVARRRDDDPIAARLSLLEAGAHFMRLAFVAAGAGLFLRPARSVDPVRLLKALRLDDEKVVVLTAFCGKDSYDELTLWLA
jgi:hypothetical protein